MKHEVWSQVRKDVGVEPLAEGRVGGDCPLYVERWVYQANSVNVAGVACPVLITQLGGARVTEGGDRGDRLAILPSQSVLVPPATPTRWHYNGPVDDVACYFLDPQNGIQERLGRLVPERGAPLQFSDALVAAAAQQLADELHNGPSADEAFMILLTRLMLEQTFRVLTASSPSVIRPRHGHLPRLQRVLRYINDHLGEALPNAELAGVAGVSEPHFRRIFLEGVGMAPHKYVQARRLAQARKLLATSELPIPVIAEECGFYNQSHLTKRFRSVHATTPAAYRRQLRPQRSSRLPRLARRP
jgi:AraC family transcriptional regulator